MGFLGILVLCPAWFGNLLLIPLIRGEFKRPNFGFWIAVHAFAIAASAYMMTAIYGDNETAMIVGRKIGFYLWLGSFMVIAAAHAYLSKAESESRFLYVLQWFVVALMVASIIILELLRPVGVSPIEAALKNPDEVAVLTDVLARNPPQPEKDAALWWAIQQDLRMGRRDPSPRVEKLLAAGANANQADKYGSTPLIDAVKRDAVPLVERLVRAGANVNARDRRGKTVLDIAQEWGRSPQCLQILENAGAKKS